MAIPLNCNPKLAQFRVSLAYIKAEQDRRKIREALIRGRRRRTIKLVHSG